MPTDNSVWISGEPVGPRDKEDLLFPGQELRGHGQTSPFLKSVQQVGTVWILLGKKFYGT